MELGIINLQAGFVMQLSARGPWCQLPYPGHPKGCPNHGKRATCPPKAPLITQWLKGTTSLRFAYAKFDLEAYVGYMQILHPDWSLRHAKCVLYWQGTVNKQLRALVNEYIVACRKGSRFKVSYCPEAMGMQVIETARQNGLEVSDNAWPYAYKIALLAEVKQ